MPELRTLKVQIADEDIRQRARVIAVDLLAAAWDEGYRQAVTDHLLQYDNSDDTPNPYRSGDPR